jgi:hypothetical protein
MTHARPLCRRGAAKGFHRACRKLVCVQARLHVAFLLAVASAFPVEHGADELRTALKDAQGYLEATRPGAERFLALCGPYAPLDLELRGRHTPREGAETKNFFLGATGFAAGLPPDRIQQLVRGFFQRNGRLQGKESWAAALPAQRALLEKFGALRVPVLAVWGTDEYRVGDLFKVGEEWWTCAPSASLGLAPWGERTTVPDPVASGSAAARDVLAGRPVVEEMRRLGVRALVRMPSGAVRVVQDGIADNESGNLFLPGDAAAPKRGDELTDGKTLLHVEPIAPGVLYYLAG